MDISIAFFNEIVLKDIFNKQKEATFQWQPLF